MTESPEIPRLSATTAAALSGHDGGALVGIAEPLLIVPATARIPEIHITLGHALCDGLERGLDLV